MSPAHLSIAADAGHERRCRHVPATGAKTLAEQYREIGKVLDVIRHRRADQPAGAQCRDRPGKLNR